MGRHRQVDRGTSDSSRVRAVPIFKDPVDTRILAQAVLALAETKSATTKRGRRKPKQQHPSSPGQSTSARPSGDTTEEDGDG